MDTEETRLVEKAKAGDNEAFEQLYERFHQPIFTYIYYRVGDQQQAEDLTGDTFVRMVTKLHTYKQNEKTILAWLYTIAGNLVRDQIRRANLVQWMPLNETDSEEGESVMGQIAHKLKQEQLVLALKELTEEQQQVILLRFIEGRSIKEVSAHLGKTLTGIKALQRRAINALRRQLEMEGVHV